MCCSWQPKAMFLGCGYSYLAQNKLYFIHSFNQEEWRLFHGFQRKDSKEANFISLQTVTGEFLVARKESFINVDIVMQ